MVEKNEKEVNDFIEEHLSTLYLQEKYIPLLVNDDNEIEENYYDEDYESYEPYDGFNPRLWCASCGDVFEMDLGKSLKENAINHYLNYHTEEEE